MGGYTGQLNLPVWQVWLLNLEGFLGMWSAVMWEMWFSRKGGVIMNVRSFVS